VTARLDELRHDVAEGTPIGSGTRLGQFVDWWLEEIGAGKSPATASHNRWALAQIDNTLRGIRLRDLKVEQVERQLKQLATRKPKKGSGRTGAVRPLGRSSLVRVRAALGEVLHEAERREMVSRNVARLARIPVRATPPGTRRSLAPDEAEKLLAASEGHRLHALFVVGLYLGLRPGELTGLPWSAVDFKARTLTVRQSRKMLPDGTMRMGETKAHSDRVLRMPDDVVDALKAHQQSQSAEQQKALVWHDTGLVFVNEIGAPLDPSNLRRTVVDVCKLAGVERISPNELRHTAATLLVARGVPLDAVSDLLGHVDVTMLAKVYRHRAAAVVDVTDAQAGMLQG
jgi:integrase